jgi:hypothetical protein
MTQPTIADWANATKEQRDALRDLIKGLDDLRQQIRKANGTPEYGRLLETYQRAINQECFRAGLPPYVMKDGEHPGYH